MPLKVCLHFSSGASKLILATAQKLAHSEVLENYCMNLPRTFLRLIELNIFEKLRFMKLSLSRGAAYRALPISGIQH